MKQPIPFRKSWGSVALVPGVSWSLGLGSDPSSVLSAIHYVTVLGTLLHPRAGQVACPAFCL